MYIPRRYTMTDEADIRSLIHEHSFGTVVVSDNGKPIASHVPLMLRQLGDADYITGHVAYANPLWQRIRAAEGPVLAMFQGPHAYVSSSWYKEEEVPTWNYQSVHIYGTATLMTEQELKEDLILLLKKYEQHRDEPVLWDRLSAQTQKQIRGIVGFKIKVEEVQAASKLSQNRDEADYESIIKHLYEEKAQPQAHHLADVMTNQKRSRRT